MDQLVCLSRKQRVVLSRQRDRDGWPCRCRQDDVTQALDASLFLRRICGKLVADSFDERAHNEGCSLTPIRLLQEECGHAKGNGTNHPGGDANLSPREGDQLDHIPDGQSGDVHGDDLALEALGDIDSCLCRVKPPLRSPNAVWTAGDLGSRRTG
ncbi:hypothetical protein ACFVRU_11585, partial [Streptomyces sp. NPDC057927]